MHSYTYIIILFCYFCITYLLSTRIFSTIIRLDIVKLIVNTYLVKPGIRRHPQVLCGLIPELILSTGAALVLVMISNGCSFVATAEPEIFFD